MDSDAQNEWILNYNELAYEKNLEVTLRAGQRRHIQTEDYMIEQLAEFPKPNDPTYHDILTQECDACHRPFAASNGTASSSPPSSTPFCPQQSSPVETPMRFPCCGELVGYICWLEFLCDTGCCLSCGTVIITTTTNNDNYINIINSNTTDHAFRTSVHRSCRLVSLIVRDLRQWGCTAIGDDTDARIYQLRQSVKASFLALRCVRAEERLHLLGRGGHETHFLFACDFALLCSVASKEGTGGRKVQENQQATPPLNGGLPWLQRATSTATATAFYDREAVSRAVTLTWKRNPSLVDKFMAPLGDARRNDVLRALRFGIENPAAIDVSLPTKTIDALLERCWVGERPQAVYEYMLPSRVYYHLIGAVAMVTRMGVDVIHDPDYYLLYVIDYVAE